MREGDGQNVDGPVPPGGSQVIHGIVLGDGIAIPGALAARDETVDFVTEIADAAPTSESQPSGALVAAMRWPSGGYAAARTGDVLHLRFFGVADFVIDLARGEIVAEPAPGREAMVSLLLAGNVLATVLGLRGDPVLHASTVELASAAVAFAGNAGAGKSTAAALLCAVGASLVGDDTARLDDRAGALVVHRGSSELRLRLRASELAESVGGSGLRTTADNRIAVAATPSASVTTELAAVAFPRWASGSRRPEVIPVSRRDATEELLGCARIGGWRILDPLRVHLRACARIAKDVPAFEVRLPEAALAGGDAAEQLRDALVRAGALESAA